MATNIAWHILAYHLPGEPARIRPAVSRQLKAAGAVHLASAVRGRAACLARAEQLLRGLRAEIAGRSGVAQLLLAQVLAGEAELAGLSGAARAHPEAARARTPGRRAGPGSG